jgi:hypothetical protein
MIDFGVLIWSFFLTFVLFKRTGLDYVITHSVILVSLLFCVNLFSFGCFEPTQGS